MSNQQDPEKQRASIEKAQEGARLLSAHDYEGAIAACGEAIRLEPGSLGAYRTRAEAYKRLGMEREADADLKHLTEEEAADWGPVVPGTCTICRNERGLLGRVIWKSCSRCHSDYCWQCFGKLQHGSGRFLLALLSGPESRRCVRCDKEIFP